MGQKGSGKEAPSRRSKTLSVGVEICLRIDFSSSSLAQIIRQAGKRQCVCAVYVLCVCCVCCVWCALYQAGHIVNMLAQHTRLGFGGSASEATITMQTVTAATARTTTTAAKATYNITFTTTRTTQLATRKTASPLPTTSKQPPGDWQSKTRGRKTEREKERRKSTASARVRGR